MRDHVFRVIELRAGMKQIIEIENIVVGGRRPHGFAPFKDELRNCRAGLPRAAQTDADRLVR